MTSPQKKVVIRKSTENREEPISPERIYGDVTLNYTPEEMEERRKLASGVLSSQGIKYSSAGKKLTPLTPEEQKAAKANLEKIPSEDANYYVKEVIGYKGGVPTAGAMQSINTLSEKADEKKITSVEGVKALFEGDYRKKALEKAGLSENDFKVLSQQGSDEGKKNLYYSILQQVNAKRKDLGPLKAKQSSFVVDQIQEVESPDSETVVEDKPDSAFKRVKDSKGAVRMVKKGS